MSNDLMDTLPDCLRLERLILHDCCQKYLLPKDSVRSSLQVHVGEALHAMQQ